jgi:hypothetical protein
MRPRTACYALAMDAEEEIDSLVRTLTAREAPPLVPVRVHDPALTARIEAIAQPAVRAVLHLMNDDIARAHAIAQAADGDPTLDYVHAIVHRRDGDWDNSKYWLSRAGAHSVLRAVHGPERAASARFVDRCRDDADEKTLAQDQWRELAALLDHARGQR